MRQIMRTKKLSYPKLFQFSEIAGGSSLMISGSNAFGDLDDFCSQVTLMKLFLMSESLTKQYTICLFCGRGFRLTLQ